MMIPRDLIEAALLAEEMFDQYELEEYADAWRKRQPGAETEEEG